MGRNNTHVPHIGMGCDIFENVRRLERDKIQCLQFPFVGSTAVAAADQIILVQVQSGAADEIPLVVFFVEGKPQTGSRTCETPVR